MNWLVRQERPEPPEDAIDAREAEPPAGTGRSGGKGAVAPLEGKGVEATSASGTGGRTFKMTGRTLTEVQDGAHPPPDAGPSEDAPDDGGPTLRAAGPDAHQDEIRQ